MTSLNDNMNKDISININSYLLDTDKLKDLNKVTNTTPSYNNPVNYYANISTKGLDFNKKCRKYLQNGILEAGTRNHIICTLIYFYICVLRYDSAETFSILADWIRTKHNGNSNDINARGVDWAVRKLNAQINYYVKKGVAVLGLTMEEFDLILKTGLRYSEQKFLFNLIRFLKNFSGPDNQVELSRNLLCKVSGASMRTYILRRDTAIEYGFIEKVKDHVLPSNGQKGKAAIYRHNIEFDRTRGEFYEFDLTLITVFDRVEIKKRYSNYRTRRLIKMAKKGVRVKE